MFKNYIKTAWRNLWKGRVFNLMNIVGLSVAIACSTLLFLTVYFEFSYDKFHENADHIYQLYFTSNRAEGVEKSGTMPVAVAPALKNEYQDIKSITRYSTAGVEVRYGDKVLNQSLSFVDVDFLKIFSFPLVKGNVATALNGLNDAAITQYAAKALFGDADPVGKMIQVKFGDETKSYVISGLVKDFPDNSSINFDLLVRFENRPGYVADLKQWDNHDCNVFALLNSQADPNKLTGRLFTFTKKYFKESIDNLIRDGGHKDANGNVFTINLAPFADSHFNVELGGVGAAPISKSYVLSLSAIAGFILLIACINFINLSVARGFNRAREVGVRKTLGAGKTQLLVQFWMETIMVCLIALFAGLLIAQLILPAFKSNFKSHITLGILLQPLHLFVCVFIFIGITFVAGFYPALLMLRYKTVQVLKGNINAAKPGKVRNTLLVVQFALSTLLIICTIITWQQNRYIQTRPLGFNKSEVVSVPVGSSLDGAQALQLLRNKLAGDPAVVALTGAYNNMGRGNDGSSYTSIIGFNYKGHEVRSHLQGVDYDYLKTLDIRLKDGRDFSRSHSTDTNAIVVNEKMAALLGGKNIVGTFLPMHDNRPRVQVIGVVKDYNFRTLHEDIQPLTLCMDKQFPVNYIFIRVKPGNLVTTFDHLRQSWHEVFPNVEFQGSWVNENTDRQYKAEQRLSNIFVGSAILAILISCIGLLAMSVMIMVQRTKEIGIRKVLGASVPGIVLLLSRDFLKLVLLASVLAIPFAWLVMEKWLQGFAYRITLQWWVFGLAIALSVIVAFVTVGLQSIRAALVNPVKSLRSE